MILEERCPTHIALGVISGKWKALILYQLLNHGTTRFGELKKAIPDITSRVLTKQLRELEAAKLIHRKIYPEVPPRVEYTLSELGYSLKPIFDELNQWGSEYLESISQTPSLQDIP
ncbi:winged helix-turn-helix transcriptional regulator [Longirhabdus pacifica]|uniref:winged helix-turn-helix transcriptional regulator n=1 Tax=Longirhabdus pacifica TaxID=2305227 RepID=UPI0013E8C56F|nr:helix-turn-helix domain-containing protein [Longirhabdus pacifica]